ncbi:MAG: hypothetical protein RIS64_158 [Bacteroidota bacterium]|jgi:linoleoyl-CoA desaturase
MQTPRFALAPDFHQILKTRVNTYFEQNQIASTGNWRLYSKAIVLITAQIVFYYAAVFGGLSDGISLFFAAMLGVTSAGIGFNVMHDGAHGSFSASKNLNGIAAFTLNILGGNDFLWKIKHNTIHHSFTNVDGVDDDIDIQPFMRMCETQPWKPAHRFQHWYATILYCIMYISWMFWMDYQKYFSRKIGVVEIKNIPVQDHVRFWVGKVLNLFFAVILPIYVLGWAKGLIGYFVFATMTGFLISIVFQLAHTVEHMHFPTMAENGKIENEWAIHQIQTTANFATTNPMVTWFCGGLNFQIEHHLFPQVSHVHYPKISRIVRDVCQEYGLNYIEYPRMHQAVASHFRFLKAMGQPA